VPAEPTAAPVGAHEYQVVGEESLLQILVYRGGTMSISGCHVIASHHLAGWCSSPTTSRRPASTLGYR
jgi:hypothetical protein